MAGYLMNLATVSQLTIYLRNYGKSRHLCDKSPPPNRNSKFRASPHRHRNGRLPPHSPRPHRCKRHPAAVSHPSAPHLPHFLTLVTQLPDRARRQVLGQHRTPARSATPVRPRLPSALQTCTPPNDRPHARRSRGSDRAPLLVRHYLPPDYLPAAEEPYVRRFTAGESATTRAGGDQCVLTAYGG